MPKLKSKGAAKKRLKLTASKRLKRKRSGHSHLLTHKNAKRKRRLRSATLVASTDEKRMKKLLAG